ncbi:MarR family winged helix-turn-helix transcriptional regulator [Schaalia suimastitidis]|uniref:MarR family winged helix-turn-helix transcriptional regulator n=1 Tax=Schaalia suimastitidis TaxID=121163 RepID=UPI00040D19EF|nr:MarR family transcriptional regulator [Schaalia suimastitidis]
MKRDARGKAWEAYLTTTTRLTATIEASLKAKFQLSLPEYNVLLQAQRAGSGGIRLGSLAHEVVFSPSRLTHTLKRLSDRGLIERLPCPNDARGGLIVLTEAGATLFDAAAEVHRDLVRRLAIDGMTPNEAEALQSFYTRVATRLSDTVR